jgi:hypothetical protein
VHEELAVALATQERRVDPAHHVAAGHLERCRDLAADPSWTAGSVITPRARLTSARPASNWGFTSSTIEDPGWHNVTSTG